MGRFKSGGWAQICGSCTGPLRWLAGGHRGSVNRGPAHANPPTMLRNALPWRLYFGESMAGGVHRPNQCLMPRSEGCPVRVWPRFLTRQVG
jgi:hypothetical protein